MTILNLLIQKSLQHRFFIVVLTLVLIGFGIKSFQELSIDAFPDVSTTQVKIIIKHTLVLLYRWGWSVLLFILC